MIKPIMATSDGRILAGHQRQKAAQAIGMETAPVYIVSSIDPIAEMRFNQLHNGTDLDTGDEHVTVPPCASLGYHDVPAAAITGTRRARGGRPIGVGQPLYEHMYIRNVKPGERILDFGCGQGDYVRILQGRGIRIWGMEFFYRAGHRLNTVAVHQMADSLFETLRTHGR